MPPKKTDAIDSFVENLQEYFDKEAAKIKKGKDVEDYTPEMRAMFLEFSDHLKACKTEIERIESEVAAGDIPSNIKDSPEEILKFLADKKASKFKESEVARTLFTIACASDMKMEQCFAFAETFGVVDFNSFDLNTNLSPLAAARVRRKGATKAMDALIDAGADIHTVSLEGNNIAHLAVLFGVDNKTLDYLIRKKVNFNQVNKNGFTPLDLAVGRRDLNFIKYLQKEAGAKFKFTPQKVQDALGDEERIEALARSRVPRIREKSAIDKTELREGVEKTFADIKVLDKTVPDAAKSLAQVAEGNGRSLAAESKNGAVANSAQQQAGAAANSDQAQKSSNIDIAKATADLAHKLAEQERHLKEQEQLLRILQKSDILPEVQSGLLENLAATVRTLSRVVAVATNVVEHAAKDEFDQVKDLVSDELGLNQDSAMVASDVRDVQRDRDVRPRQVQQPQPQQQHAQSQHQQSQPQAQSPSTKLAQPQQGEEWRKHLEPKAPAPKESFVAKVGAKSADAPESFVDKVAKVTPSVEKPSFVEQVKAKAPAADKSATSSVDRGQQSAASRVSSSRVSSSESKASTR